MTRTHHTVPIFQSLSTEDVAAYRNMLWSIPPSQLPRDADTLPRRRHGRPPRLFPDRSARPSRALLEKILPQVWWWGWTWEDGPVFCHFYRDVGAGVDRNKERLIQVTLGPDEWAGIWGVDVIDRRLGLDAYWFPDRGGWIPQWQLRDGNGWPWTLKLGEHWTREDVRRVALTEGLITSTEWDRMAGPRAVRESAMAEALPALWV